MNGRKGSDTKKAVSEAWERFWMRFHHQMKPALVDNQPDPPAGPTPKETMVHKHVLALKYAGPFNVEQIQKLGDLLTVVILYQQESASEQRRAS